MISVQTPVTRRGLKITGAISCVLETRWHITTHDAIKSRVALLNWCGNAHNYDFFTANADQRSGADSTLFPPEQAASGAPSLRRS